MVCKPKFASSLYQHCNYYMLAHTFGPKWGMCFKCGKYQNMHTPLHCQYWHHKALAYPSSPKGVGSFANDLMNGVRIILVCNNQPASLQS